MIGKKEKWEKPVTFQCMGASCLCFVVHGEGGSGRGTIGYLLKTLM